MNRLALALAVAALVLPAAGCGEGSSAGAAGASVAPAGAKLFVSVDTSFDSDNWGAARALLDKFPDGDRAVESLMRELGGQGVDFERDVKPALGPETDFVGLDLTGEGKVVGLTQPDDPTKLSALLAKSDPPLVSREIGGWAAFSDSEANLDEFESMQRDGTLDGVDAYEQVSAKVADDALVHVYAVGSALPSAPPFYKRLPGPFKSLALSLNAEDDGVHVHGALNPATSELSSAPFRAELPSIVPGGVFLYANGNDLERQLGAFRDALAEASPGIDRDIARVEAEVGVSLDEDVFPLFSGESAFYVRPGFPIPEITLVSQVEDAQGAMATLDKLGKALVEFYPGADLGLVEVGGVPAKQVRISQLFSIYYAAFDGRLVLTTSQQGIADLQTDGNRLADDEAFKAAIDAAGTPDETTGFLYVDLEKAIPALVGLAAASGAGISSDLQANLEPLHSVVFYGGRDGDLATFSGVLAIQ